MKAPRNTFVIVLALMLATAVPVLAQVEFTFEGFSMSDMGQDVVGSTYTIYGIANPPSSAPTPLPLDFANNQYTICVTGMSITSFAFDAINRVKDYAFAGGVIQIFEDPIAGGTTGDYLNPGTFTDGTMLLQAAVDTPWEMLLDDPIFFGYSGAGIGTCDMNGGTELANLVGMEYLLNDWAFAGTGIAEPSFFVSVPAGYDLAFGVKVIFPHDPTPNQDATWSDVKTMFR